MKGVILAFATFIAAVLAEKCPIFECGSVKYSSQVGYEVDAYVEDGNCVKVNSDGHHYVQKCKSGFECTAKGWHSPSQATSDATCVKYDNVTVTNYTVPGDICSDKSECFGLADEVNCINNTCTTTRGLYAKCPDIENKPGWEHKWCPVNTYCRKSACYNAFNETDICGEGHKCKFGYQCIKSTEGLNVHECYEPFSFKINDTFYVSEIEDGQSIYFGYDSVCKNYNPVHLHPEGNYTICKEADRSLDATLEGLKREKGNGELCHYETADGTSFDLSQCGFNKDESGWCNKRRGDQWFVNALNEFKTLNFTQLNCHVLSGIETCSEFKMLNQTIIKEFKKALLETDYDSGFANFANNDKCVAESITSEFWQGDNPDSASWFTTPILVLLLLFITLELY